MLINKEQFDHCRWIIATCESENEKLRGHEFYQFAQDKSLVNLHQRYNGQTFGLRAYNDKKIISWLESLNFDLFHISQNQQDFDNTLLPNIGIHWNEYRYEPMASTSHTVLEFMNKYRDRKTVFFSGDFWMFEHLVKNKIENIDQIDEKSALVISYPFFEYFEKHKQMDEIMMKCEQLGVPVMLDLIWLPLCKQKPMIKYSDCVEVISHSFTKLIPLAGIKCGIAFWKSPVESHKITYPLGNRLGAWLVSNFLQKFGYDHALQYVNLQNKWCNRLGLQPTNMVLTSIIPDNHFLSHHDLHKNRLNTSTKLFSLIGFYECDRYLEKYLKDI